ncbi:MAG TPA: hypothetical protein VFB66_19760 [Tepidisphaeraceae bacterium]|nr:hypothetical protein [Tepidisphaeraceae bacterium]
MKAVKPMALLLFAFAMALAAGVTGGLLLARLPAGDVRTPSATGAAASPLAAELGLSAKQAEEMKAIWEGVRDTARECSDDARRLQRSRDDALVALLTDEQKEKFEKVSKDYAEQFDRLNDKRDQAFREAVKRTKQVLDEGQWRKYERILRGRVGPDALRGLNGQETAGVGAEGF